MDITILTNTTAVKPRRWTARITSISWAYWALFWTMLLTAHICPNNPFMWAILIPVLIVAFVLYLGAAILASVWGKEKLGGRLLIADGVLIFAQCILFKMVVTGISIHPVDIIALLTIVLPPLIAGILFLKCYRMGRPNEGVQL